MPVRNFIGQNHFSVAQSPPLGWDSERKKSKFKLDDVPLNL